MIYFGVLFGALRFGNQSFGIKYLAAFLVRSTISSCMKEHCGKDSGFGIAPFKQAGVAVDNTYVCCSATPLFRLLNSKASKHSDSPRPGRAEATCVERRAAFPAFEQEAC